MASKIKVDQIEGSSGSTITVPTGQTFTITDGLAASTIGSGTLDVARLPTVTVAKGGTNLTSFAAGDILYATGSTTLAKLPKGTAAQTLKMNSGATAPEWTTVAAATSDYVKIATTTITSATAAVDFVHGTGGVVLDNTYQNYIIYASKLLSSANTTFKFQISLDTGSSWKTSGYISEAWRSYYSGGSGRSGQSDGILVANGATPSAYSSACADYIATFYQPHRTDCMPSATMIGGSIDGTTQVQNNSVQGGYVTIGAYDGIRCLFDSGDINAGTFTLFGQKA